MSKLVIELQKEAMKGDSNILDLLRKAYFVARKLKLEEFKDWVDKELNGYKHSDIVPEYRLLRGEIRGWNPIKGWIPIIFIEENVEYVNELTNRFIPDPIANIIEIYRNSKQAHLILQCGTTIDTILSDCTGFNTKYSLIVGINQIYNIIEYVKNNILKWSILLEENGILGEDMQFSNTEKEIANKNPEINNYITINNIHGNVINSKIQQDTKNSKQK